MMAKELKGKGGYKVGTDDYMRELCRGTFFEDSHFYEDHFRRKIDECTRRCADMAELNSINRALLVTCGILNP
jgi:hypothetical protein